VRPLGSRAFAAVAIAGLVGLLPSWSAPALANRGGGTPPSEAADLLISKTASSAQVPAGGRVTYTVTLRNDGPASAEGVLFSDPIPGGTILIDFQVVSAPAGTTCNSGGVITCQLGTLGAGQTAEFVLTVLVPGATAAGTVLTNTATASTTTSDPDLGNNTATATTLVVEDPNAADLSVSKTGSGAGGVPAGRRIEYTVTIRNNGPASAEAVSLTDTLPAGTTLIDFLVVSAPAGATCTIPPINGVITCQLGTLAAGATAEFVLTVLVDPSLAGGTVLTNTATATTTSHDPDLQNNTATATTFVRSADLAVTKAAASVVEPGGLLTYTITITNLGPTLEPVVSLGDQLPANTTLVQVSPDPACTAQAAIVSCQLGQLAPGGQIVVTVVVLVDPATPAGTVLANTAVVGGADQVLGDPNLNNNSATVTTTVVGLVTTAGGGGTNLAGQPAGDPAGQGGDLLVLAGTELPRTGSRSLERQIITALALIAAGLPVLFATRRRRDSRA